MSKEEEAFKSEEIILFHLRGEIGQAAKVETSCVLYNIFDFDLPRFNSFFLFRAGSYRKRLANSLQCRKSS